MEEKDLDIILQSDTFKRLLQFEPTDKALFCFLGEDHGEIVTGLSGVCDNQTAEIQTLVLVQNEQVVLKEGLVRSAIHMLERLGIEFLETNIQDDVFARIGFKQTKSETQRISTKDFFANPGCTGC